MNKPAALQVFVSYSHRDEAFVDELRRHLSPLTREGLISIHYDRDNLAGSQLDGAIYDQITSAGMFLALISSDYIHSDYCFNKELPLAMECRERGTATVIPVILRPCDWMNLPIATLLALPTDGVPVTSWKDRDEAFFSIAKGIRERVFRSGWHGRAPEERRAALEQPLIQALFEPPANTAQVDPVLVPAARRVLIRSEGICELLDDILITPSNVAPPADTADVYLELFLNSPITSRLLFGDLTDTSGDTQNRPMRDTSKPANRNGRTLTTTGTYPPSGEQCLERRETTTSPRARPAGMAATAHREADRRTARNRQRLP